jgi:putative ABC transport system permease protein
MDFKQIVRSHLAPMVIAREPEIVDELALHLSDLYREGLAEGLSHDDALARATAALPSRSEVLTREIESASRALPALIVDRWRVSDDGLAVEAGSRWSVLADFRRDLRYAVRMLARTPGFTFIVCLTLALGIGANTVIFTAVDAIMLRSAPVADPESVVSIYTSSSDGRDRFSTSGYPDYLDLRDSGIFTSIAAYASIALVLDNGGVNETLVGELVTGNYFDVLGVRIPLGRTFSPDEDRSGSQQRVVVVSHETWTRRFGADPGLVGRTITLNGNPYTVMGIAPRGFTSPVLGRAPEMWAPAALQPELRPPSAGARRSLGHSNLLSERGPRWLNMIARRAPGTTVESTLAAANVLGERLERAYPDTNRGRRFTIVPLGEGPGVRASTWPLLRQLSIAVVLVLLIACANVASLLLVRAVARRREVAVRMAVGAGRGRLVRQWLTESVLLGLAGAAGGVLLTIWCSPMLHELGIPESVTLAVNGRVLLVAIAAAVVSGVLFGLAPVLQTLRRDTITAMREDGGAVASGAGGARLRSAFVIVQVALSTVLLVGAGLFLRTLHNALSVDLGYRIDDVLVAGVNLDVRGYAPDAGQTAYAQILERVRAIPGVEAAGAARVTVLSGGARTTTVSVDGLPLAPDGSNGIDVRANTITEGYLDVLGIPLLRGRNFEQTDRAGTTPVAIVSERLAARLHPGVDPIGRSVRLGARTVLQIVGVVRDTAYRSGIEQNAPPILYVPLAQNYESGMTFHVRSSGDPLALVPSIRRAVQSVDPQLVLGRASTLRDLFGDSLDDQRLMATLVGVSAGLALLLAAVGVYGVMAHAASQRTSEIGIRLALGAGPGSILQLMLGEGLRLVLIGSLLGLAGAFAGVRYLEAQLFGVAPTDPLTFVLVSLTLLLAGLLASYVPARRAMRVNPSVALRAA